VRLFFSLSKFFFFFFFFFFCLQEKTKKFFGELVEREFHPFFFQKKKKFSLFSLLSSVVVVSLFITRRRRRRSPKEEKIPIPFSVETTGAQVLDTKLSADFLGFPLTKEQRSLPNDATQLASNDSKRAQIIPIPFSAETTGAQVLDTKLSADFLGFPVTREQRSLPNDATQLASNDSKRAHFIHIPFSAETTGAQVLDTKLSADFLDFFAHLRVKSNEALDVDEIFLEE
jgi:hypothetical protein